MVDIIQNPPPQWVLRLREGCQIWLVKEQEIALVVAPFTPSVGGHITGQLFIRRNRVIDYWYVSDSGHGINGSLLMLPIQGSLPDTPAKLTSQENEELLIRIAKLENKVRSLERILITIYGPDNILLALLN